MHALHVVRAVLGFSESFFLSNLSLICGFRSLKHSSTQSSIDPLYYVEFLDLASPPRAIILRKYAHYSVIIVNTDGAAAVQHLISSPSGANSYQGQPSPRIYNVRTVCKQSSRDVKCNHTLNRPQAEVHRMQHSGCSKERFLGTDYAVKTFVKKIPKKYLHTLLNPRNKIRLEKIIR